MASGQFASVLQFLRRAVRPGPNDEPTDRQLLARFTARRDDEAFAALVRRHGPMVLAVARRVLDHAPDADDAFQATFLVLAEKSAAPGWQESVGSWLYEVAYRVAMKLRGDSARRRLHERQVPPMATVDADTEKSQRELRSVLDEELTRLPDKYRAPLVLCYLEGKTNDEAAMQLGWTKGTVSGRLARARDLLRARLTRRGLALPAAGLVAALTESVSAASVPPALLQATVQAAVLGTAARAAAAGAVAAPVAALAQGVARTMFLSKLKIAALVILVLGLLGTGAGIASYQIWGRTPSVAFAPLPEAERKEAVQENASKPVRVNGVDFEIVTDRAWPEPGIAGDPKGRRNVAVSLRVTNPTKENLLVFDTIGVHMKGPDGKELKVILEREQVGIARIIEVPAGKSALVRVGGMLLRPGPAAGGIMVWGQLGDGTMWSVRDLQPGVKYTLSLSYQAPKDADNILKLRRYDPSGKKVWQGQVQTGEVSFEIVKPAQEQKPAKVVLRMEKRKIRDVLSTFTLKSDGSFTYDGKSGVMPKAEVTALMDQAAKAKDILQEEGGFIVTFTWSDADGTERFNTLCGRTPDAITLLAKLADLKERYAGESPANTAKLSADRARLLKQHIDKFTVQLNFFGESMRGYYSLKLSTDQKQLVPGGNNLHLTALLTGAQANKLIDHLAADGFLAEASDRLPRASDAQQRYGLEVSGPSDLVLTQVFPWDRQKLTTRLGALRKVLEGDAATQMDKLLARLAAAPADNEVVLRMVRRGGLRPKGGMVVSKLEILADGSFTYDAVKGKLPKEEIAALVEQIAKADVGPAAEDAGTIRFSWMDKDGMEQSKLFTRPGAAQALVMRIMMLTMKHGKAEPLFRMEERLFKAGEGKLIAAPKDSGRNFDVAGGQVVSQLRVEADGSFTYDGVKGKMPVAEVAKLIEQLAPLTDGLTAAAMDRSVQFFFADKDGKERSRLYTYPGLGGEEEKVLKKLTELKAKYGK